MLAECLWADVKVGADHIQLFAEPNALGVQASVYNVNAKNWIAPSEFVNDIQPGQNRAATLAEAYIKHAARLEMPVMEWNQARYI